jgi:predicted tellurium resistance membrane protein TerC
MEILNTTDWIVPLITLFFMELVLGIDNIIFISILVDKVPLTKRKSTMNIGLVAALVCRIILLFCIGWLVGLTEPIFTIRQFSISGRDLILFLGGFFLLLKTCIELHHKLFKPKKDDSKNETSASTIRSIIVQIIFIDIIFSFDSILTAVGLVEQIWLMITAVIASMLVMMIFAQKINVFINKNPGIKLLALSFLLLIGGYLILESLHFKLDKTLLYFGMGFALFNEFLNMQFRKNS